MRWIVSPLTKPHFLFVDLRLARSNPSRAVLRSWARAERAEHLAVKRSVARRCHQNLNSQPSSSTGYRICSHLTYSTGIIMTKNNGHKERRKTPSQSLCLQRLYNSSFFLLGVLYIWCICTVDMSSEPVIDLCESSVDEENANETASGIANPNLVDDSFTPAAVLPVVKAKSSSYFWDSSDDEEVLSSPKKDRQRRRKSKLVTPEDAHLKKPAVETDDDSSYSREGDDSPDIHRKSKRKQPRTLFLKSSKPASNTTPLAFKTKPASTSGRAVPAKITTLKETSKKHSTLDSDDSSSDESIPFSTVFSKRKLAAPKTSPHTATINENSVIMLDSFDEESENLRVPVPTAKATSTHTAQNSTPVVNPYLKRQNITGRNESSSNPGTQPQSSLATPQILQYPRVGPNTGRQYGDIRATCLLALWRYSRTLVSASYNLSKLDSYCRRIKDLALSTTFPIRSLTEYVGSGNSIESSSLREALCAGGVDRIKTPHNRDVSREGYYSIAEAALVSMLELVEEKARSTSKINLNDEAQMVSLCSEKEEWVYLSDLIPKIDQRLNTAIVPSRLGRDDEDNGEAFYTNPSTRSAEFKQLDQLTKTDAKSDMPLLKTHRKNKRLCYELTLRGLKKALYVRNRRFPEPPGYLRTSKLYDDAVEPCFQGICLVVDNREGGGASKKLHSMCQGLDMRKVPYIVAKLDIGDYAFVSMDSQKLIPIIIERKSIQDAAQSIWDGRWVSQKLRMYQGQYVFGFDNCRLAYLIEGQADGQELTGGAIGQTQFNINRTQLDTEIGNLQAEGFEVLTTNNMNGSLAALVELTKFVAHDYRSGKLKASLTHEEFMARVQAIPRGIDFSRIARDHRTRRISENGTAFPAEYSSEKPSATNPLHHSAKETSTAACQKHESSSHDQYNSWKVSQLKEECEEYGLPKTGKKADLIVRLSGPRPPKAWLQRKKANLYVPARYDTCGSAILVSIWLHQRQQSNMDSWKGLEKEDIIALAENLKISKDPFTGTGKGLFNYDGWSCIAPLREGQSPLIFRQKGGFFKLTTIGGDMSGFRIAEEMHDWCHAHQKCQCKEAGLY